MIFDRLAVAVVDEQHRFGVRQRAALDAQGAGGPGAARAAHDRDADPAHAARWRATATSTSRRCASCRAGAGRSTPTSSPASAERARAYERIREELRAGRQAFVVCPLVEESEALAGARRDGRVRAAARAASSRDFSVVLLHGQMRPREKQAGDGGVRRRRGRRARRDDGHRGRHRRAQRDRDARRGRRALRHLASCTSCAGASAAASTTSLCLLFGPKESRAAAGARRAADGFRLAEIDLELRGEGELTGTRQSGLAALPLRAAARGRRRCSSARTPAPRRCWPRTPSWRRPSTRCSRDAAASARRRAAVAAA